MIPGVTAAPTMIPGVTAVPAPAGTGAPAQPEATAAASASAFDFGDVQESVYDDADEEARAVITSEQVQAGATFSGEQLHDSEMAAKELLYMDQMQE